MKQLLQCVLLLKKFWLQDKEDAPYPLTNEEWEFIQQDCRKKEVERALKVAQLPREEFAEMPLLVANG